MEQSWTNSGVYKVPHHPLFLHGPMLGGELKTETEEPKKVGNGGNKSIKVISQGLQGGNNKRLTL